MRRAAFTASLLVIVALVVVAFSDVHVVSSYSEEDSPLIGPYVDEVIYKVISNQDQRVLALQAGEIQLDNGYFNSVYYPILNADPDISIHERERNGYGQITINCAKYPLNISGLRRAFAFAYNKTKLTYEMLNGFGIEHDSLVPQPNGWCIEDQFDWHYYDARSDIGNQILDNLGFTINATSGFRLTPNGTSFEIIIEAYSPGSTPAEVGVEALLSLHINASSMYSDFNDLFSRLDNHEDYDMIFNAINFYSNDIRWLAYDYWSNYADVYEENPANFRNDTYDSWRDHLLYGTTYEEVYEAAAEMQKILHYNVPKLAVYTNTYLQGYRNDVFTGHIESILYSICNQWTIRKIHTIDGIPGGSVSVGIEVPFVVFNFFVVDSTYTGPFCLKISSEISI